MMEIFEQAGDVKIYGRGALGGKGEGLAKINSSDLPQTRKLKTRILTTAVFDRFKQSDGRIADGELNLLAAILEELGDVPIGVRSSATDEAGAALSRTTQIRAGENISFMLPNNHPDSGARLEQLKLALSHIYNDFIRKQPAGGTEKMAIVVNPIPGIFDDTQAGPFYYPYISGVANSFFPYALKTQKASEGFARIAFGHGYATVLDDFPVISMATIKNPIPLRFLRMGAGQQYFYALDMTRNKGLSGQEMETMKTLHVRFANYHKIKLLGIQNNLITIEELVQGDHFGFKSGLNAIMEKIAAEIHSHFQIEFVFNINFQRKDTEEGYFHIVQLTLLPEMKFETVELPAEVRHTYLSLRNLQGHGIKRGIKYAVVVSPFLYDKEQHDDVRKRLSEINRTMRERNESYIMIVPGRLGSTNREWGIQVNYRDVDRAAAIFEYGVDIAGRARPLPEDDSLTGGIYGSHFLYMIQGGFEEEQRRYETRMYGTQGTHFLTNLVSNNVIYGYVAPLEDEIDPWFFSPARQGEALSVLTFPESVTIYADSVNQRGTVVV